MKCRRILAAGGLFLLLLGGSACTPEMPEPDPSETSASVETQAVLSDTGEGGFSVYTDWSKLEVYQPPEEQYTRWYHEAVHELLPLEDGYGTLVPFVGSFPPDRSWGGVYQYGLMTMDGAIVVDTTYSDVWRMTYYEGGVQRLHLLFSIQILLHVQFIVPAHTILHPNKCSFSFPIHLKNHPL